MNNTLRQLEYERICDDLYYLGDGYTLKFNVDLAKKDKNNNRQHFHKEFKYNTNKYFGVDSLVTLKRSFDFYMTIERYNDNNKEYYQIRVQDIMMIRQMLYIGTEWLMRNLDQIWVKKDKDYFINQNISPVSVPLGMDKFVTMEPSVIRYDNGDKEPSLRLTFNDGFVDMNMKKFYGLYYIISSINMYESAQIMLNYIPQIPYGTNAITFDEEPIIDSNVGSLETKVSERKLPCNRQPKSFFAKMDDL